MLKLYNTLSRKKDIFKPIADKKVGLYACGPTVYWYAHIGNLRSYIFSDILKRVLDYNNYKVKFVMNFTDVDDKTIKGAIKENGRDADRKDLRNYTRKYIKIFKNDIKKLNINEPFFVRATDVIDDIKKVIKELLKQGFAYIKDGSTYFDIRKYEEKYKDYGQLVGKDFLRGLKFGVAVSADEYQKENIGDFVLWKKWNKERDGNIFWPDEILGKGRPGWHIECSVISMKYLGEQFDIHTGGVDLIFPHHSNEIAQSQAFSGKVPFVRYWLHPEHLIVEGEKMAKSKGNFYTLKDIEKTSNPLSFRYLCLTSHYRSKLNFTWGGLASSQKALNKLYEKFRELKIAKPKQKITYSRLSENYKAQFTGFINDDLNIPGALALMWKMIDDKKISRLEKYSLLLDFDKILGLSLNKVKKIIIPDSIQKLVDLREKYRQQKKWSEADKIRQEIERMGWQIEDTPKGPKISKKD